MMPHVGNVQTAVGNAIDHRAGRDADHGKARRLRLDNRDTKRLVGHRRDVEVGACKPGGKVAPVAAIAWGEDALGREAGDFNFNAYSDARSIFRYDMHALPNEIQEVSSTIGTSTLFAAWNDAAYVAQIEDHRLEAAMRESDYLDATREVLQRHQALWFNDESYVISRKRDSL